MLGAALFASSSAKAWTFPEHIMIGQDAIVQLAAQKSAAPKSALGALNDLWDHARRAAPLGSQSPYPLCGKIGDDSVKCVGIGSLVALAGDHSCSSDDMLSNLNQEWVRNVLSTAHELWKILDDAGSRADREDMRRRTHVMFQNVDDRYLSRAKVNTAHFQLPRERADDLHAPLLYEYVAQATLQGQGTNATALYIHFHLAALALAKAARIHCAAAPDDNCAVAALHAVSTESFALHFLEDSFSSGHFIGHHTKESFRIGTHDEYSSRGFDVKTWHGRSYAAFGDAFMSWPGSNRLASLKGAVAKPVNLTFTAEAAAASLEQLGRAFEKPLDPATEGALNDALASGRGFDTCERRSVPDTVQALATDPRFTPFVMTALRFEPIPSARVPEPPLFRAEKDPFFGPGVMLEGGYAWQNVSEFLPRRPDSGFGGRVRSGFRLGVGLSGVATSDMEDQAFVDGGFVLERFDNQPEFLPQTISGGYVRVRAPFVFIPILEPILVFSLAYAKNTFGLSQATWASSGGIGGLQRPHAFGASGRWSIQFTVLRDISFLWLHSAGLREGTWRHEFTSPFLTLRHRFPFSGSDWAISSDLVFDLGYMIGWRNEEADNKPRMFGGPNLSVSMGARIFP